MGEKISIKTRAFGGFDKKQVNEYLDLLRDEYEKAADTDKYDELNAELNRLRTELNDKDDQIFSLRERLEKIHLEQNSSADASRLDALADSTERFAKAHGEVIKIAEETGSYIKATGKKLPKLLEKLSALSEKIEAISSEIAELSAEFDELCPAVPNDDIAENVKTEPDSFFDLFAEHEEEINEKLNSLRPKK